MHTKKSFALIVLLMLLIVKSQAQDCPRCDIALLQGARDEVLSISNATWDESMEELFSYDYSHWSSQTKESVTSAKAKGAYAMFSGSASGSGTNRMSKEKFEELKQNYEKNRTLSTQQQTSLSSKIVSAIAYKAWTDCVLECGGGIFLKKEGNNNDEFIISLKWIPTPGVVTSASVTSIVTSNCTYIRGNLQERATITHFESLIATFKRTNAKKDITITVSVGNLGSKTVIISKDDELQMEETVLPMANVPPGTVVAFAGTTIPRGWLLCDGSIRNQKTNSLLFNAIGTAWGSGDATGGSFNLPDMRGMFLRGVDVGDANNDPDHDLRVSRAAIGGNTKNKVGTFQDESLKRHFHIYAHPGVGGVEL